MTRLQRRLLCAALALIIAVPLLLAWQGNNGIRVDTNLKSLSPTLASDPVVAELLEGLTAAAEQRFVLVFVADSALLAQDAADQFSDLAEPYSEVFGIADGRAATQRYAQLLRAHQFHLLYPEQVEHLARMDQAQLRANAVHTGYGLTASMGLLALRDDPFGWANEFARDVLDSLAGHATGLPVALAGGAGGYAVPLVLQLHQGAFDMTAQRALMAQLTALQQQLLMTFPTVDIWHSGVLFFAADAARSARADVSLISTGSALGVLLLVAAVFRSLRPLLLALLSIAVGVASAFAVTSVLYSSVHVLTIVFGASLVGVVVDYALHFFYVQGQKPARQIDGQLLRALALSLVTSMVGYAALSFSGLLMLQQVALFSIVGLLAAWLFVVGVGPVIYPGGSVIHDAPIIGFIRGLTRPCRSLQARHLHIAFAVLAAMFMFAVLLRGGPVNDTPSAFFSLNPSLLAQERKVDEIIASYEPASFVLVRGETTELVYERIAMLEEAVGEHASGALLGIQRLLPAPSVQQAAYKAYDKLYGMDSEADGLLRASGLNASAVLALQQRYAAASGQVLSPASLQHQLRGVLPPLWVAQNTAYHALLMIPKQADLALLAAYAQAHDGVEWVSVVAESTAAVRGLRQSAASLLLLALVLVAIIMALRYRSVARAAMAALPAASVMITLLLLQLGQVPVSLFHIMALFLVVGLGMDYIIFLTEISGDATRTMAAVVLSALTSLLSFGLLAFSSLPVMSAFGLTMVIGNSCNVLGALLLASVYQPPVDPARGDEAERESTVSMR